MQLFVWDDVDNATNNWHPEGGVVVVAADLESAREMIRAKAPTCAALTEAPDHVRECSGPEFISIHPNAGCC